MLTIQCSFHLDRGSHEKALEVAKCAVTMSEARPISEHRASCYTNLGNSYAALHELSEAKRMFEHALRLTRAEDYAKAALILGSCDVGGGATGPR